MRDNTVSAKTLARIDLLVWVLIYGGMFLVALGIASHGVSLFAGWSMGVVGTVLAGTGVLLIFVRSRLQEIPAGGAQSASDSQRENP